MPDFLKREVDDLVDALRSTRDTCYDWWQDLQNSDLADTDPEFVLDVQSELEEVGNALDVFLTLRTQLLERLREIAG